MSKRIRCAIYTRKSTDEGLDQDFNSLDAQREACEAFIQSQRGLGWKAQRKRYDDGGISGGTMERPALQNLLTDIKNRKVDLIVVYKVDRLTRSLMDFARIIETFDASGVSFVSVTQQFNTANSMGRLTLNVLLSFAQFEREVTAERIRDKIAASKKKGMWMGGLSPLGYDAIDKKLVINEKEATLVRSLFDLYLDLKSVRKLKEEADHRQYATKQRLTSGRVTGGQPFTRGHLYQVLHNPLYVGEVRHKEKTYPGQHEAIIKRQTWDTVQKLLDEQAPDRRSPTNTKHRCLLTGLVFDEDGDRVSPSNSRKNGRRYHYYISKQSKRGTDKDSPWRLPAGKFEEIILHEVCRFLNNSARLMDAVHGKKATSTQIQASARASTGLATAIKQAPIKEIAGKIRKIIERVVIAPDRLRLTISRAGLSECVGGTDSGDGTPVILDTPMSIRRRGVESKFILSGSTPEPAHDDGLIKLIADSHKWFAHITAGDAATVREVANLAAVDLGDVSRFLPLAFLAPDIVEAILNGRQPVELTAERLKRLKSLPKTWDEQRKMLGFTS